MQSMSSALVLPTPIGAFIEFLNGKAISPYEDSAEHVLSVLSSLLHTCLRLKFDAFLLSQKQGLPHRKEGEFIRDLDIANFLFQAFPSLNDILRPGPIQAAFAQLSPKYAEILFMWLTAFRNSELDPLRNPSSQIPLFGIVSGSQARASLYSL